MGYGLCFAIACEAVIVFSLLCSSVCWANETVLEEVVKNDDQVPEELVNRLFADGLSSCLGSVAGVAQEKEPVLLV